LQLRTSLGNFHNFGAATLNARSHSFPPFMFCYLKLQVRYTKWHVKDKQRTVT